jgi:hypothetical protein
MIPTKAATQGMEAYSMGRLRILANIDDQPFLGGIAVTMVVVCLLVMIMQVLALDSNDVLPAIVTGKESVVAVGARRVTAHEALLVAFIMAAIFESLIYGEVPFPFTTESSSIVTEKLRLSYRKGISDRILMSDHRLIVIVHEARSYRKQKL